MPEELTIPTMDDLQVPTLPPPETTPEDPLAALERAQLAMEALHRYKVSSGSDSPTDQPNDDQVSGRPKSATAWIALLAAEARDERLAATVGTPHQPVVASTRKRGINNRYTLMEILSFKPEELRLALWNCLDDTTYQVSDRNPPVVTFYMDKKARSTVKQAILEAFEGRFTPTSCLEETMKNTGNPRSKSSTER
jgi:hypothetical protein